MRDLGTSRQVDWSLADGHDLQIEVAVWLLWLYAYPVAEYVWLDQMCIPQDSHLEKERMHGVQQSPRIYQAGKVYVVLAPVVDEEGRIMSREVAGQIVDQYTGEMSACHCDHEYNKKCDLSWDDAPGRFPRAHEYLRRAAIKSLLVNHTYMRRVWTIQEVVSARTGNLHIWPFEGSGSLVSYQSVHVVDWPEFNAWNNHPRWRPVTQKFTDSVVEKYMDGDYAGVIGKLRSKEDPDVMGHLALLAKELKWITDDRSGLVAALQATNSSYSKKAHTVLNYPNVMASRASKAEDLVLALVPLVDPLGWQEVMETANDDKAQMVQKSVDWAYEAMEQDMTWSWSIRIYNKPSCTARALDLLEPRRNLTDHTAVHGTTHEWSLEIPSSVGDIFRLTAPRSPAAAANSAAAATVNSLEVKVLKAVVMPHPGLGGPVRARWDHVRNAVWESTGSDNFWLAVSWALEPWRSAGLQGLDLDRTAVVLVDGEGLRHLAMIILALKASKKEPYTAEVMAVLDIRKERLPGLLEGLQNGKLPDLLTKPLRVVSRPPPE
ncbi:hypothetical protein PLESTB_000891600 [Pleodorina starrii]|uniref:Heterokaryon incompatibility domain-containing protein n=1 Tax=Pleodorina starrii TaxID=330485 RepID=A0A9W6BNL3_9CHLO|nr:hypothetical protein PLESTB_000891600 [Pleodorina starrii]